MTDIATTEELSSKIALVTGASRGIGRAIANRLASSGATVIGTATTDSGAEKITQHFAGLGLNVTGMKLNVSDSDDVASAISHINSEYGAPTIIVNNAGITRDNIMLRMKDEEWFDVIDTNLNAAYRVIKASLKGMTKARWGRIINIGSVVGSMGNAGQSNYAATKAGVAGFSRALAKEIGSRNITVNTIAPGFIATDMTDELSDEQKQSLLSNIPLQRLGSVDDIAEAVLFLSSDRASYITGETLNINGGMYMG